MKVALVCPYDLGRHGGVQDQVAKLASWLAEAGHRSVIIGPGRSGPDGAVLLGPTLAVPANRSTAAIGFDPRLVAGLRRAVEDVDVVHIHEPLLPLVGSAAMLTLDRPKVVTFHADPSRVVRRLYRIARPLVGRLIRRASVVTAVSPVAASVVDAVVPVRLVPNGIEVDSYAGTGERHPQRVVFVGRDDPRKGLDLLLRAWGDVAAMVPGAELVVVGVENRTGHSPSVRFMGRVSEGEKKRILCESSVMCAPNTGGESFGIVLVEGMAAGCAVVASGLPGFAHVLGDAGALVAPGDVVGLSDTLVRLLDAPEMMASLANRSRERVRRFDREVVLGGYLEAYQAAIG